MEEHILQHIPDEATERQGPQQQTETEKHTETSQHTSHNKQGRIDGQRLRMKLKLKRKLKHEMAGGGFYTSHPIISIHPSRCSYRHRHRQTSCDVSMLAREYMYV